MSPNLFTSLLVLLFIALKLCHVIEWSWFWVLSPVWITIAIAGVCMIVLLIYYTFFESKEEKVSRQMREYLKRASGK